MSTQVKHQEISNALLTDEEYRDTLIHGLAYGLINSGTPLVEAKVILANAFSGFDLQISYFDPKDEA